MTIINRRATEAYLHALNNMKNCKPNYLARVADRMMGEAVDREEIGHNPIRPDAMMSIETSMFVGLCEANDVDWRLLIGEDA